jgi:hypothetical protein
MVAVAFAFPSTKGCYATPLAPGAAHPTDSMISSDTS